ncbi:MAG: response regulator [Candidatus Omnitrophota bacterium]|jgi:two-component system, probable response regulator PhcQ
MPNHTILIVDDEQNILSSLSRLLRADDRDINTAGCVQEGIDKLKSLGGVDLVISDNRLPDGQGVDFLVKVKQLYPDSIRILFTGYPDLEAAIQAINKGQVYRFITKPWENEELKMIVKQSLDYFDVIRDNRVLIKIARQQAEWLEAMQKKYPQVSPEELNKGGMYIIEEQKVSENLADFIKKYYPQQDKGSASL